MDPDAKDRSLSHPNAKILWEKYEWREAIAAEEGSVNKIGTSYGMNQTSDEDFMLYRIIKTMKKSKRFKNRINPIIRDKIS